MIMEGLRPVQITKLVSKKRTPARNWQLGILLAFVAGYINAGGFFIVGRYTSHVTGIVSEAADQLALGLLLPSLALLGFLLCFITGAAVTTMIVLQARRFALHSQYSLPLLAEALLLSVIIALSFVLPEGPVRVALSIATLCFLMGLQNALITKASTAIVRTTHVTGLSTDLGIELGRWISGAANSATTIRLALFSSVILTFFMGGLLGALLIRSFAASGLVPVVVLLLVVCLPSLADDLQVLKARNRRRRR